MKKTYACLNAAMMTLTLSAAALAAGTLGGFITVWVVILALLGGAFG